MPTCLRGRGVALVNLMSMLAMVAAPYIVYSVSSGQDVSPCIIIFEQSVLAAAAPTLLIAALAVLGSVPAVFLPETAGLELPDTVEEMERCGVLDTVSIIYEYIYLYNYLYILYLPEICTGSGPGTGCAGCRASGPGTGSPRRRRAAKTGDTWTAGGNHKIDNNLVISNQ